MTAADLIEGAFRVLGVLAAEETPSASEQEDGLEVLNELLDSWANDRLALFATLRSSYTLTPSLNPHTIGSGGTFNATRPVKIDRASIVYAGSTNSEIPLEMLSDDEWQIRQGKASTGVPSGLWIESAYPLMKLWLNPIPQNADTLVLYTWQQLTSFASASDTLSVPVGYARALRYNLAKDLAPEYGVQLSDVAAEIAAESLAKLKRTNTKPLYLRSDAATLRHGGFNLISGDS